MHPRHCLPFGNPQALCATHHQHSLPVLWPQAPPCPAAPCWASEVSRASGYHCAAVWHREPRPGPDRKPRTGQWVEQGKGQSRSMNGRRSLDHSKKCDGAMWVYGAAAGRLQF